MTMTSQNRLAYERVRDGILQLIVDQSMGEGDRLPSQRELSSRFGVSQRTVMRGIDELSERGLLERRVGSGVYVNNLDISRIGRAAHHLLARPGRKSVQQITVGVLTDAQADLHRQEMLRQLQQVAATSHLDLLIRTVDVHCQPHELFQQVLDISQQNCDAILIHGLFETLHNSQSLWERYLDRSSIPLVFTHHIPRTDPIHYWGTEFGKLIDKPTFSRRICEMVVQYMMAMGCERVGFWGVRDMPDHAFNAMVRFVQICAQHNLSCQVGLIGSRVETADEIVRQWLPFEKRSIIYCYDDQAAQRLMTSLHKHGVRIPDQVGVIGHNDTEISQFTDPPLTSVKFPFDFVARAILHYISTWVRNGHPSHLPEIAMPELSVRQSCGGHMILGSRLEQTISQINRDNRGHFYIRLQESES